VQSQPVIMGDVSPGRALKGSTQTSRVAGSSIQPSNYCLIWCRVTAFRGTVMFLTSYRHERINTRKTLIIQSCPDDDMVNLEFLDEVRFYVFM